MDDTRFDHLEAMLDWRRLERRARRRHRVDVMLAALARAQLGWWCCPDLMAPGPEPVPGPREAAPRET